MQLLFQPDKNLLLIIFLSFFEKYWYENGKENVTSDFKWGFSVTPFHS